MTKQGHTKKQPPEDRIKIQLAVGICSVVCFFVCPYLLMLLKISSKHEPTSPHQNVTKGTQTVLVKMWLGAVMEFIKTKQHYGHFLEHLQTCMKYTFLDLPKCKASLPTR